MEKFSTLRAIAVPYRHADVDTDDLIPLRFLRKPLSVGYGKFLLHDKGLGEDGEKNPNFVLHQERYKGARILVSGSNFGCGSAREGAVYALHDYGIRAVIAPSFADIFIDNCVQNGVLPAVLPESQVDVLCEQLTSAADCSVTIDLVSQTLAMPDGTCCHFEIKESQKVKLIKGLDNIGITLEHREEILRFESSYFMSQPWLERSRKFN